MKGRRILITGAAGFVGRALALGFADLGWQVIALDRVSDAAWKGRAIQAVAADLSEGVPHEIEEVDVIVHAAWVTADPVSLGVTTAEYFELNLKPLLGVLAFAGRTRPTAFVFLSSSGVFGPRDGADGLTDAHQPQGDTPYATAKRAGETLVAEAFGQGVEAHVVRLGYLYGPGETARASRPRVSLVSAWLSALHAGRPLEVQEGDPQREWTFTADLAGALERLVTAPAAGRPVHLGSSHIWKDSALAALIASQTPSGKTVTVPAQRPFKPPMIPSDLPALRGFEWTDPVAGLRVLRTEEAA